MTVCRTAKLAIRASCIVSCNLDVALGFHAIVLYLACTLRLSEDVSVDNRFWRVPMFIQITSERDSVGSLSKLFYRSM